MLESKRKKHIDTPPNWYKVKLQQPYTYTYTRPTKHDREDIGETASTKSTFIDRRVRINQVKLVFGVIYFRATCFVLRSLSLYLFSTQHPAQSRFVFSNIIVVDYYLAPRLTFTIVTPFMPITLNFVNLLIRFLFCRANFLPSSFYTHT